MINLKALVLFTENLVYTDFTVKHKRKFETISRKTVIVSP